MPLNNDDELAPEGVYFCPVCDKERMFKQTCYQALIMRRALNFENLPSQIVLCCEQCKTPLNHF